MTVKINRIKSTFGGSTALIKSLELENFEVPT
jgi:hypothetical protein